MGVAADFHWSKITIGNTLDAIRFATTNKTYLLFNSLPDVNSFNLSGHIGSTEEETWAEAAHEAYEQSLVPIPGPLSQLRIDGDVLTVRTPSEGVYRINFEHINLFATNNINGLEECFEKKFYHNKVVDWFDIQSGGASTTELINSLDSTIKQISFYKSSRLDGKEYYDLFSVSHLSDEQLRSHDYSDTLTKFKIQKIAAKCGVDVVLDLWKRDVFKIYKIVYNNDGPQNVSWHGTELEVYK